MCRSAHVRSAEGDYEVIAFTHHMLGDSALADHGIDELLPNYQLVVKHTYRFNVKSKKNLDSYTIRFYSDMSQRLVGRVESLGVNVPRMKEEMEEEQFEPSPFHSIDRLAFQRLCTTIAAQHRD